MTSDRSELEALGRDDLLARARKLGIPHPELMTRLELLDELLRTTSSEDNDRRVAKGLLGKARDLVARMMDLGLHLPDAAQRLRPPPVVPAEHLAPPPIATVALAGVYAAQGHRDQALAVLDEMLAREPSHEEALRLQRRLTTTVTEPASPLEPDAPTSPAAPPSDDELHVEWADGIARLRWRVRPWSFAHRSKGLAQARLVLRVVHVHASSPEPDVRTLDVEVDAFSGTREVPFDGEKDCWCAAVGVRTGDRFQVITSAP